MGNRPYVALALMGIAFAGLGCMLWFAATHIHDFDAMLGLFVGLAPCLAAWLASDRYDRWLVRVHDAEILDDPRWLTTAEVADFIGITSAETVYRCIHDQWFPGAIQTAGGRWRIPLTEVLAIRERLRAADRARQS